MTTERTAEEFWRGAAEQFRRDLEKRTEPPRGWVYRDGELIEITPETIDLLFTPEQIEQILERGAEPSPTPLRSRVGMKLPIPEKE